MNKDDIIVFTSGAGQYYHIEAVARVARDFTPAARDTYSNSLSHKVAVIIEWLLERGYIENVNFNEFNVDQTRHNKISHTTASSQRFMRPRTLNYAYKEATDSVKDLDE